MSIISTRGALLYLGSAPGTAKAISAITNAANAVATLEAAHGVAVGEYVYVRSGWAMLDRRLARASAVAGNDVTLEGIDTSDTSAYPPGAGAGTVQEFTWATQLSQIEPTISTSGGEIKTQDGTFLEHLQDQVYPDGFSASQWTVGFYTDASLAWLSAVRAAVMSQVERPFMFKALNNQRVMYSSLWSLNEFASIQNNSFRGQVTLLHQGRATVYAT